MADVKKQHQKNDTTGYDARDQAKYCAQYDSMDHEGLSRNRFELGVLL